MKKLSVMLSSTVDDLLEDREVIYKTLSDIFLFEVIGANPIKLSSNESPYATTINFARKCNLFILLLGGKYGHSIPNRGSATSLEFDTASQHDPTKILVFKKSCTDIEKKQQYFIKKVSSYTDGHWFTEYKYPYELANITKDAVFKWLIERIQIADNLNCYDHFLRLAIQRKPTEDTKVQYSIHEDRIEFIYNIFNTDYFVQINKKEIYNNFWKCIMDMDNLFEKWKKEWR